jgi:hypothetical protein
LPPRRRWNTAIDAPLLLTVDRGRLRPDEMAALDAWRDRAVLGQPREACLAAAIAAYWSHHPALPRSEAIAAIVRLYLDLDLDRRAGRL